MTRPAGDAIRAIGADEAEKLARAQAAAAIGAQAFARLWTPAEFAALLASPVVIARGHDDDDGGLAAFALAQILAPDSELLLIGVAPPWRRRGRARALLSAIKAGAKTAGAARMVLEVACDNAAAIALYTQAGFKVIARRKAYYRRGERSVDAIVMECRLT